MSACRQAGVKLNVTCCSHHTATDNSFWHVGTWIALLRGINVISEKPLKMAELQTAMQGLGLAEVQTYVQSGNDGFKYRKSGSDSLASSIHNKIKKQ